MSQATAQPRIAWIFGASTGLGAALARHMAQQGWQVAISARRGALLRDLAEASQAWPGRLHPYPLDIRDKDAVTQGFHAIEGDLGPLDQVVVNAGSHQAFRARDLEAKVFEDLISLNVMGPVHCLEAVLPAFTARRSGRIALVASLAGYRGLPTAAAYGLTKAGLINMAEALQPELAQAGVVLQIVNPGFVRTPLTDRNDFPMPFLMEPDDAAAAFYRGLETDRFEIVFPRRFAALMKLYRLLPADWALALAQRWIPRDETN